MASPSKSSDKDTIHRLGPLINESIHESLVSIADESQNALYKT